MYNYTDHSEEELRDMSEAFEALIKEKQSLIDLSNSYGEDLAKLSEDINKKKSRSIARLREMNVRALTALQIVKDRQTTLSN